MSAPRRVLLLGTIAGLSLVGCVTAVPQPSGAPARSADSSPTASASPAVAGPSVSPSPGRSIPAPADAARWLDGGSLGEARNATSVVVLGTGEVMVVGSDYQTSWLSTCGAATEGSDSVEIGNPGKKVWKMTARLPSRREAPAVVALSDGRVLLTGGEMGESNGNVSYSSTYVFDPRDRSWTRSGLMNTARSNPAAALLADGRVLVGGGRYIDKTNPQRVLDSSEIWDPRSGSWSRTGPLDDPRVGASAVTLADGRALIVGGVTSPESAPIELASSEVYDPKAGRWSSAGSLAENRSGFALVALPDGGALVVGGFGGEGFTRLSTAERFDPVSNTWSAAETLPSPVAGASAVLLADGRVLLAGGTVREPEPLDIDAGTYVTGLTTGAFLFDPGAGAWTATTPMPRPRAGASAVLLADGSAVFAGGSASEGLGTPGCPVADPRVFRYVPGS